jgi:glucokinase
MKVLVGDVGGTNTRLALVEGGEITALRRYPSGGHDGVEEIVRRYLAEVGERPAKACLGVAGPVQDDRCAVTNLPWVVDARALEKATGIARCRVVNDFVAAAMGVTVVSDDKLVKIGGKNPRPGGRRAVLGAGTGLGVAFLVPDGEGWQAVDSEGGHREFGPRNELEIGLLEYLLPRYGHVSYERICSGPGLKAIYDFLVGLDPAKERPATAEAMRSEDPPAVITKAALDGTDVLCERAVTMFLSILGAEAGNLALQVLATGGVFVAGGIPPRLATLIADGTFRVAFEDKGRLSHRVREIPAYLVTEENLGLRGAAVVAERA